jgi:hypothetical protein
MDLVVIMVTANLWALVVILTFDMSRSHAQYGFSFRRLGTVIPYTLMRATNTAATMVDARIACNYYTSFAQTCHVLSRCRCVIIRKKSKQELQLQTMSVVGEQSARGSSLLSSACYAYHDRARSQTSILNGFGLGYRRSHDFGERSKPDLAALE